MDCLGKSSFDTLFVQARASSCNGIVNLAS